MNIYIPPPVSPALIKLTDEGIDLTDFDTVQFADDVAIGGGMYQFWVQPSMPVAKAKDVWIDTDDYSRYDVLALSNSSTLSASSPEIIIANGTFAITLHAATMPGIVKKIYNVGSGIITIAGVNLQLYPGESAELITDGNGWRY